ncbi:MAG: ATP-binding cassette domain-containing protein [Candidatus Bathyarchaeia archaeon]
MGEFFGLLGPNGAGKTSTINVFCVLLEQNSGKAFVGGHDVKKEPDRVKGLIGVCSQYTAVYTVLAGKEYVSSSGTSIRFPRKG